MDEEVLEGRIGGSVYELIIKQIIKNGISNTVTGDIYISRKHLRQEVLGRRCRIPEYGQVRVIKELLHLRLMVESKGIPDCVMVYNNAEVFYCVPTDTSKRFK